MRTIKYLAILAAFMPLLAIAGDSTSGLSNPSVGLHVVTAGTACSTPGLMAQTATGVIASCEGGIWTGRALSNPELVWSGSTAFSGFGGKGHYVACPTGKRAVSVGCILWATVASVDNGNFGFIHDESSIAGGINGFGMPLPGDQGAYCLMVAETGNTGAVIPVAICVDR